LVSQNDDPSQEEFLRGTDAQRELKMQDIAIDDLSRQIQELEQVNSIERQKRPARLPPLENGQH